MSKNTISKHQGDKINLHTHSHYCGHGGGELYQYVEVAKKLNFTALGFSEHCPLYDNRWSSTRMDFSQIDNYMDQCRTLQKENDDIIILCGFEVDHHPDYHKWYIDNLVDNNYTDYLALAIHFVKDFNGDERYVGHLPYSKKMIHRYADAYIAGLESKLYQFGVHPDLFAMFYIDWDEEAQACSEAIVQAAVDLDIPLEINGQGLRRAKINSNTGSRYPYPTNKFWEVAQSLGAKIIFNTDAHYPEDLDASLVDYQSVTDTLGIEVEGWEIENFRLKTI